MAYVMSNHLLVNLFCTSFLVIHFAPTAICAQQLRKLPLPGIGPESFAFDWLLGGPFTGLADGRAVRYAGPRRGFVEYGYTAPNRSAQFCNGINRTDLTRECGRPLGMEFYHKTAALYIADAAYGLVKIKRGGGLAEQVVSGINGVPFRSPDGLEVDQRTGTVYFTEASMVYNLSQMDQLAASGDQSGRVLKYDPNTNVTIAILVRLGSPSGVAISKDGRFLLVAEGLNMQIRKYWLEGPRANTSQVILKLSGNPNKIRRNSEGDFWIAVTTRTQHPTPTTLLQGVKINGNGIILKTLTFSPQFNSSLITEVKEFGGSLYLGSMYTDFVGVYSRI